MDTRQNILVAKTALLETVCIALLIDRARAEKDPVTWFEGFKRRFRNQIDEKSAMIPDGTVRETASLAALEAFDSFFDRLERGILALRL